MRKRNKVSPYAMKYRVCIETISMKCFEQFGARAFGFKRNAAIERTDVTKRWVAHQSISIIKMIYFFSHFLRQITTTVFVRYKPDLCIPRTISVEMVHPVSQWFFFNDHRRKI